MSEEKLLPCPFCGSKKVEAVVLANSVVLPFTDGKNFRFCVLCRNCKTVGTIVEKQAPALVSEMQTLSDEAKAAWNRRAGAQWTEEMPKESGNYYVYVPSKYAKPVIAILWADNRFEMSIVANGRLTSFFVDKFCHDYPDVLWQKITPPPLPGCAN